MADNPVNDWKEVIIDHSQFPRRHGQLEHPSHEGQGENPFCGDRVQLQLSVDDSGHIQDIRFQATGCAISIASASLLSSSLVNRNTVEAEALFEGVHGLLTGSEEQDLTALGELEALQLVRQYPLRVKCATLVWHVLKNALGGVSEAATTE